MTDNDGLPSVADQLLIAIDRIEAAKPMILAAAEDYDMLKPLLDSHPLGAQIRLVKSPVARPGHLYISSGLSSREDVAP